MHETPMSSTTEEKKFESKGDAAAEAAGDDSDSEGSLSGSGSGRKSIAQENEPEVVDVAKLPASWSQKFVQCTTLEKEAKKRSDAFKDDKARQKALLLELEKKLQDMNRDHPRVIQVQEAQFKLIVKPGGPNPVNKKYIADFLKQRLLGSGRKTVRTQSDIDNLVKDLYARENRGSKDDSVKLKILLGDAKK